MIDAAIRLGVVQLSTSAWYDPETPAEPGSLCKRGNPNMLTRNKGTSRLGQWPSAHYYLIEVERCERALLPVTAHQPPVVIRPETQTFREDNT